MGKSGFYVILMFLALGESSSFAQVGDDSCNLPQGPLSSLPMPCEGTQIIVRNPKYCGSCAIKDQSTTQAPAVLDDVLGYFSNEKVIVGANPLNHSGDLQRKGASCVGEKAEQVSYMEYVRRRELCREKALEKRAKVEDLNLSEMDRQEIALRAHSAVLRDQDRIQNMGGIETFRKKMSLLAEKYKRDHRCLLGVRGQMRRHEPFADSPFEGASTNQEAEAKARPYFDEKMKKFSQFLDEKASAVGSFCSSPFKKVGHAARVTREIEVTIPMTAFFANSTSSLGAAKTAALKSEILKQIKLKPELSECEVALTGVDIYASANKLGNGQPYGKWDFPQLASDRAIFVRDQIFSAIDDPHLKGYDFKNKTNVKLGDQGTGASGACPYRLIQSGEGVMTVELDRRYKQAGTQEQKEIEKSKVVKAVLRFRSKCEKNLPEGKASVNLMSNDCIRPEFSCINR